MENSISSLPVKMPQSGLENLVGRDLSAAIGGVMLPLATALSYAASVAAALRERHGALCAQTKAGPDRVQVGRLGVVLLPPEHSSQRAEQDSDIMAFGALLYELTAGSRPPRDLSQVVVPRIATREGLDGVRVAAMRLALQCLGATGDLPDSMQQVFTEVRLYSLMARQCGQPAEWASSAVHASLPEPPHSNQLAALTEVAPPLADETVAIGQGTAQPVQAPDEYQSPKVTQSLASKWFVVPDGQTHLTTHSDVKCPLCHRRFVHRSRPRTLFECLLAATGIPLNRCHRCLYRYIAILGMVFTKRAVLREPIS
jgi:hypothetical protein